MASCHKASPYDTPRSRALSAPPTPLQPIELSAPPEDEEESALSAAELARWLWNPAASFIETVLKAGFEDGELYEPTGALTELTSLAAAKVGNEALRAKLESRGLHAYIEAAPEFPDGSWGAIARRQLTQEIEALRRQERGVVRDEAVRAELLEARVGGTTLRARFGGLGDAHRVVARFTKPARQAELSTWVEHLLMQSVGGALPRTTHLVLRGSESRAKVVSFAPVDDPENELESLVRLYRTSKESPVPLFERASREFAEAFAEGEHKARKIADDCLKAQRRWDERLAIILGADDPFANESWVREFERAALEVYGPLLKHRSER
jgi:exonuclease V gamma subunit